ncbi:hypothetical protein PROAA_2550010 [Candidatus Propionivibrio aalborgensis]|uniref:Uncharacterized protein n=1 Tax=Candidatus Propionivibrio aalborgensis TaxID=1860101 RepID=A0A1A8XU55_9RHOO|nr:hypothetical protein PROAA_2550010 [Candidatus Propionivibrio aalborgensis]
MSNPLPYRLMRRGLFRHLLMSTYHARIHDKKTFIFKTNVYRISLENIRSESRCTVKFFDTLVSSAGVISSR